jgi:hypothetical protein
VSDWKLRVSPVLTLENKLPKGGRFTVYEKPPRAPLEARQEGDVDSGQQAGVLAADVRQPIFLKWEFDGWKMDKVGERNLLESWFARQKRAARSVDGKTRLKSDAGPSSSKLEGHVLAFSTGCIEQRDWPAREQPACPVVFIFLFGLIEDTLRAYLHILRFRSSWPAASLLLLASVTWIYCSYLVLNERRPKFCMMEEQAIADALTKLAVSYSHSFQAD